MSETVGGALLEAAGRDPDRVWLDCDGRLTTVGEVELASRRIAAAASSELGLSPGDRAAVMMGNVPEFVECWMALARCGVIEVPVHTAYRGPLLEHVLFESAPRVLFCDEEFVERLAGLSLPALEALVVRGDPSVAGGLPFRAVSLAQLAEAGDGAAALHAPGPREISCILYTSGTTGRSKGVALPYSANLALTRANVELMGYGPRDVLYTAFPLFHVNAKFTSVMAALVSGGRLVLDQRFSASAFWDRMRERSVTAFNYMGAMLTILDKQPERADDADNPVERCYGAACPPALWPEFERRFGVSLREHYGMTEIGIATMNTEKHAKVGTIGRAAPYFEVRIADAAGGAERPDGEVGEIQVRPREPGIVVDHYWGRLDATAEAFRDLWFHTGDLGRRDADGYFQFVDRAKDSVRRRGENISSFEVESVVNSQPGVLESAAFGVPSELGEEELMVAVVPQWPGAIEPRDLLEHCRSQLPDFAVPRYIELRDSIPKNASQRIQKFKLRERGVTEGTWDRLSETTVLPGRRPR